MDRDREVRGCLCLHGSLEAKRLVFDFGALFVFRSPPRPPPPREEEAAEGLLLGLRVATARICSAERGGGATVQEADLRSLAGTIAKEREKEAAVTQHPGREIPVEEQKADPPRLPPPSNCGGDPH